MEFLKKINLMGEGRNWVILVFSLLLAFFMWGIMKLSDSYSSYVKYRLEVTSNIEGRKDVAQSTDVLIIGAKSTGFKILQNDGGSLLKIGNVDSRFFHRHYQSQDMFYLIPDDIKQTIQDALGADIAVEMFATDTLFFEFPLQANKKVPVVAASMITCADQFMPYAPLQLKPDSLLIYGDESVISLVEEVSTGVVKARNADRTITGMVKINPVQGIRFSEDEVMYTQEIGRYVEHVVKVPVTIDNAPSYANVAIIPQEVTVRYRQPFGSVQRFTVKDFPVALDYNEVLRRDVLKPVMKSVPEGVLQVEIEPKFVECVL